MWCGTAAEPLRTGDEPPALPYPPSHRDPVLVRAGRGLVPTPRAEALRLRLRSLVTEAEALVRDGDELDLSRLERTFVHPRQ